MAVVDGRGVRLSSRNGSSITLTYPEISRGLREALGDRRVVLDGEVVALDGAGRPSFGLLQRRMHAQRPAAALVREVPAALFVFDVLAVDGEDVTQLPYVERRAVLEEMAIAGPRVAVPPAWTAADGVDGVAMLDLAAQQGMEGVVAKRLRSRYRPGERSPDWIKHPLRIPATLVVCGWIGTRARLEALLLAAPHPAGELRYVGHVGTGFLAISRRELLDRLGVLEVSSSPLLATPPHLTGESVRWVRAELVGEVHYREFTGRLRHPSWRGLRQDIGVDEAQWPR